MAIPCLPHTRRPVALPAAQQAVCACRRRTSARGAAIHGRSICVRRAGIRQWPTNSQRERLRSSEHGGPRSWSPRPQPSVCRGSAEGRRFVLVCDPDHEHVCGSICCRESIRMLVSRSPRPGCCPKRERNLKNPISIDGPALSSRHMRRLGSYLQSYSVCDV